MLNGFSKKIYFNKKNEKEMHKKNQKSSNTFNNKVNKIKSA